jgi:hypothetical protein
MFMGFWCNSTEMERQKSLAPRFDFTWLELRLLSLRNVIPSPLPDPILALHRHIGC